MSSPDPIRPDAIERARLITQTRIVPLFDNNCPDQFVPAGIYDQDNGGYSSFTATGEFKLPDIQHPTEGHDIAMRGIDLTISSKPVLRPLPSVERQPAHERCFPNMTRALRLIGGGHTVDVRDL